MEANAAIRDDNDVNLFMESMQVDMDMETQFISDKYGFNFNKCQPLRSSQYQWFVTENTQLNLSMSKSQVAESNFVKIQKPRMMSIDDDRHSTNDDTVFHTQSDQ